MKTFFQYLSLLVFIIMVNTVSAKDVTDDSLKQIMSLSGLEKQIAEYPGMFSAGMDHARKSGSEMPDGEFNKLKIAVEKSASADEMLSIIREEVRSGLSEEDAQELLIWLKSDIGRRITKAEEAASTPEAFEQMMSEAQSLFGEKERIEIAKHVDGLVNATDQMTQIQENTMITVYSSISKAMNPNKEFDLEGFKTQLSEQREKFRANNEVMTILSFVYAYKNLDIQDLENYVAFLEQPSSMKYIESVNKGLNSAFDQWNVNMEKNLTILFHNKT